MRRVILAICLAGWGGVGLAAHPTLAANLCVGSGPGCYATIQAALNAAHNGLITFSANTGSGYQLYTVSPNGNNLQQITPFTFDVAIKQDWAPDGRHIVFTNNADVPQPGLSANILTVRPDGADLRALTNYVGGQVNAFAGSYAPDGHWIVFRLEDHGRYGLYRMDADGGPLHAIIPLSSFKPRFIDWGAAPGH